MEYSAGPASLFVSSVRRDPQVEEAIELLKGRTHVTTLEIRELFKLDSLEAYRLMLQLEQHGVIGQTWNVELGGYPVLL